ncbi:MAG: S41 family peptidase [Cellulosilyticaceae bacterium]
MKLKNKLFLLMNVLTLSLSTLTYAQTPTTEQPAIIQEQTILLTKNQMIEDYHYMWGVIEDSYPFLGVVERLGIDYKVLKEEGLKVILEEDLSIEEFYMLLGKTLGQLRYTGHIGVVPYYQYDYMKQVYMNAGEARAWHNEVLGRENVEKMYGYLTEKYPMDTDSVNEQGLVAAKDNVQTKILETNNIAYVKINSFGAENVEQDQAKLEKFYKAVSTYPNLIIDLTDNGGGSDAYWMQNIVMPNIEQPVTYATEILLNDGYYTNQYIMELMGIDYFKVRAKVDELENIEDVKSINPDIEELDYYIQDQMMIPSAQDKKLFEGKIYILMDETVYSSSESFVKFCKESGFATLVGTPSGGDGGGIDPMVVATPNSGIVFKFSVLYTVNEDGRNNEEFGTAPDIMVLEGETPLQACLRTIKSNR